MDTKLWSLIFDLRLNKNIDYTEKEIIAKHLPPEDRTILENLLESYVADLEWEQYEPEDPLHELIKKGEIYSDRIVLRGLYEDLTEDLKRVDQKTYDFNDIVKRTNKGFFALENNAKEEYPFGHFFMIYKDWGFPADFVVYCCMKLWRKGPSEYNILVLKSNEKCALLAPKVGD